MKSLPLSLSLPTAVVVLTLAGCAMPPSSTVLSRLPDGQSGAATATAQPLTTAEKQRYDAIDRQVLREQNEIMLAEAAARAYSYYAPTPGGYYGGGWNRGWGTDAGYGYPGWRWGL
ncbi:MAG: hypothetical protein VB137_13135 [Burkholderia sp.]